MADTQVEDDKIEDLLTMQEIKDFLTIDYMDEMTERNLKRKVKVADLFLQGAVGKDYPKNDERVKELALFVIEDLYDRNSNIVKETNNIKRLKDNLHLQLVLDGRDEV